MEGRNERNKFMTIALTDMLAPYIAIPLGIGASLLALRGGKKIWVTWFVLIAGFTILIAITGRDHVMAQQLGITRIVWHSDVFILNIFLYSAIFTLLISRWHFRDSRWLIMVLGMVAIVRIGLLPAASWTWYIPYWSNAKTLINQQGVCIQSTTWSCGPAATVSAMADLGIQVSEAQLALASQTNPFSGTKPLNIKKAIEALPLNQSNHRLHASIEVIDSISNLNLQSPTLALVKQSFLNHHYVCILQIQNDRVLVADPESGLKSIPIEKFNQRFLKLIIRVKRFSGLDLV